MKKYKLGLAVFAAVLSLCIFGKVLADSYARTPSAAYFQNTTVNFSGVFTTAQNAHSYKIVVDGVSSTCSQIYPPTDEVSYNKNITLAVGPHYTVQLWSYESNDDECEEYPHVYQLEGVTPAFTITN